VQYSTLLDVELSVPTERKPRLESLDSGPECSLAHLLRLYRLVENEDHSLDGYVFDDSCLRVS
jgi:hypothetical protein